MAPKPPGARRAPAEPWRASILRPPPPDARYGLRSKGVGLAGDALEVGARV